ncbi:hypothetical protein BWQ96_07040 [Gracilariopsis chorda]|uniref:Uncharacterized protein n=1 Tax=Gracilariopsis chorda TaxID=448386 RepID=A0A2V3IMA5_9FLOR|nr:hypothetical protein BWQ96_07040 [Gracilariopsis chorda]|eukprot:PXF43211.1 hypothetical protein BWQ96_07040 [Gracilariopsis chorda]
MSTNTAKPNPSPPEHPHAGMPIPQLTWDDITAAIDLSKVAPPQAIHDLPLSSLFTSVQPLPPSQSNPIQQNPPASSPAQPPFSPSRQPAFKPQQVAARPLPPSETPAYPIHNDAHAKPLPCQKRKPKKPRRHSEPPSKQNPATPPTPILQSEPFDKPAQPSNASDPANLNNRNPKPPSSLQQKQQRPQQQRQQHSQPPQPQQSQQQSRRQPLQQHDAQGKHIHQQQPAQQLLRPQQHPFQHRFNDGQSNAPAVHLPPPVPAPTVSQPTAPQPIQPMPPQNLLPLLNAAFHDYQSGGQQSSHMQQNMTHWPYQLAGYGLSEISAAIQAAQQQASQLVKPNLAQQSPAQRPASPAAKDVPCHSTSKLLGSTRDDSAKCRNNKRLPPAPHIRKRGARSSASSDWRKHSVPTTAAPPPPPTPQHNIDPVEWLRRAHAIWGAALHQRADGSFAPQAPPPPVVRHIVADKNTQPYRGLPPKRPWQPRRGNRGRGRGRGRGKGNRQGPGGGRRNHQWRPNDSNPYGLPLGMTHGPHRFHSFVKQESSVDSAPQNPGQL